MRHTTPLIAVALLTMSPLVSSGQTIPFDEEHWKFDGPTHEVVMYDGQESLLLRSSEAVLLDDTFLDGTIEFDVAFSAKRTFTGLQWRRIDDANAEEFYFRPHLAGEPDANQYTPRTNGLATWQLHHGPQYSAATRYKHNAWQHVKVVVSGRRADIYIDSDVPSLTVDLKREPQSGALSLWEGGLGSAYYANFTVEKSSDVQLTGTPVPPPDPAEGAIMAWSISDVFSEALLEDATGLPDAVKTGRSWKPLASESTGLGNIAQVAVKTEDENTVIARLVIESERDQVKAIAFGYSDRVRVFHGDDLLYAGTNTYRTRDYRFLGTIGLFDEVYVKLNRGTNEVWFAVSESFGGWGITAAIEDMEGISLTSTVE